MKIAVLNFSGNVGKTTLAHHLLLPRLTDPTLITVETTNVNPDQINKYRPQDFPQIGAEVLASDHAVVDVGSTCLSEFLRQTRRFAGSIDDFDAFLVPTTMDEKVVADTVVSIAELVDSGADPGAIFCLTNRATPDGLETLQAEFLAEECTRLKVRFDPTVLVHQSEAFTRSKGLDLRALARDSTDYRTIIRSAADEAQRGDAIDRLMTKRLAIGVVTELDEVFNKLFGTIGKPPSKVKG